ncbi:MAG: Fe-S-containing protein [Nitrospiraceae bacterium]|nr:Fe-S-containing protein [Nitrospiraceae bacterium]
MKKIAWTLACLFVFCSCARKPAYPEARLDGQDVRIVLSGLREKTPEFFTFRAGDTAINYFVVKVGGDVQSYFDACAKCYPKKLGYRLERGRLVCRACDVHYGIEDLKDGIGSCYPIRLPGRIDGTAYVISRNDILAGGRYF